MPSLFDVQIAARAQHRARAADRVRATNPAGNLHRAFEATALEIELDQTGAREIDREHGGRRRSCSVRENARSPPSPARLSYPGEPAPGFRVNTAIVRPVGPAGLTPTCAWLTISHSESVAFTRSPARRDAMTMRLPAAGLSALATGLSTRKFCSRVRSPNATTSPWRRSLSNKHGLGSGCEACGQTVRGPCPSRRRRRVRPRRARRAACRARSARRAAESFALPARARAPREVRRRFSP